MNQYISFAVVFGDGGGGGSLVGYILSWGPITWNQKKPWEEWGQWEYRAQGRTIIEEMTQEDEPKKKARGKSNPGKYSTRWREFFKEKHVVSKVKCFWDIRQMHWG